MRPEFAYRAPGGLETGLLFLAFALQLGVAGELLVLLGWDIGGDSGAAYTRFHPGTYLLFMALGLAALRYGNPLLYLDALAREPRAAACLILSLFVVGWDIRSGFSFTGPIEAFVVPAIFCLLLSEQDDRFERRLALFMHAMMALNALLAIAQYGSLVPRLGEYDNARSSGLLGHPLTNGCISALYILSLGLGGGRDLPRGMGLMAIALQLAALPTFGARTSTVIAVVGLVLIMIAGLGRSIFVPPSRRAVLAALTLGPLALLVGDILYEVGFFTPLIARFMDDSGSTNARLVLPTLIHNLTPEQFWFGVPSADIGAILMREGIEYGIESFWFGTIVLHGALAAAMLWAAYGAFSLHTIYKARPMPALFVALAHTIIISSANSISTKSNQLDFVIVIVVCMLRRERPVASPAVRPVQKRERRPVGAVGQVVMARPLRPSRLPPAS